MKEYFMLLCLIFGASIIVTGVSVLLVWIGTLLF